MISYNLLAKSVEFYEARGYQRIEAPWLVTPAISKITKPHHSAEFIVQKDSEEKIKSFVASGEQGFLYLINKGHLPESGTFQTITPCMRNDSFDSTHTKYFLKNELISYGKDRRCYSHLMSDARDFMKSVGGSTITGYGVTEDTADLYYKGVEVGSYGERTCDFVDWTYGTGLAEPRFSRLLKR